MAAKEKRYKYIEDLIEEYLYLTDERIEIPLSVQKIKDKFSTLKEDAQGGALDKEDAEDFFKLFNQERKLEERRTEIEDEYKEVNQLFKEFLQYLDGHQISYEKKDDVEKTKLTYLFWLENGEVKSNRELSKNSKRDKEFAY